MKYKLLIFLFSFGISFFNAFSQNQNDSILFCTQNFNTLYYLSSTLPDVSMIRGKVLVTQNAIHIQPKSDHLFKEFIICTDQIKEYRKQLFSPTNIITDENQIYKFNVPHRSKFIKAIQSSKAS